MPATDRFTLVLPAAALALLTTPVMSEPDVVIKVVGEAEAQVVVEAAEAPGPLTREEPAKETAAEDSDDQSAETGEGDAAGEDAKLTADQIRQQMAELQKQLDEKRQLLRDDANAKRQKEEQQQREKVENIKLPENPTREQCEAYMAELRTASEGRRGYSSNDPIVGKLRALPPEHYDLLIKELSNHSSRMRWYANYALRGADLESMREKFTTTLAQNPANIGVIIMNGWAGDVKDSILEYIKANPDQVTPNWFQAAVEVAGPEHYALLHDITIKSRNAHRFIEMLRMLPDYDLAHTVNVCWSRAANNKLPVSQSTFVNAAVELGNVEALGQLISQLNANNSFYYNSSSYNTRRIAVLERIAFRGSNKEIRAWYNQNKDNLVFDQFTRQFIVLEDTAEANDAEQTPTNESASE